MGLAERWIIAKYSIKRSMKRNKKIWIIASSGGAIATLITTAFVIYLIFYATYTTAVFSADVCEYVFGCTSAEFSSADLDAPEEILELRESARIGPNGALALDMTLDQCRALQKSEWITNLPELEEWPCISLSDDHFRITITVTPEMKSYDSAKLKEFEYALNATLHRIAFIDIIGDLGEIDDSERLIYYKEIDEVTGRIITEEYVVVSPKRIEYQAYDGWAS